MRRKGKIIAAGVLLLLALMPMNALADTASAYENVAVSQVTNYVNVRTEPRIGSEIVGKIYNNCAATILATVDGQDGKWYQIQSGTVQGYIKAEFFITGADAEKIAKEIGTVYVTIDADNLRLRKEPNLESEILTLLSQNDEYIEIGESGEFMEIQVDADLSGFVHRDYVKERVEFEQAVSLEEERLQREEAARLKREADEAIARLQELQNNQGTGSQAGTDAQDGTGSQGGIGEQTGTTGQSESAGHEPEVGLIVPNPNESQPTGGGSQGQNTGENQPSGPASGQNGGSEGQNQNTGTGNDGLSTGQNGGPNDGNSGGSGNASGQGQNTGTQNTDSTPQGPGAGNTGGPGQTGTGTGGSGLAGPGSTELTSAARSAIVAYARQFLGNPYVYGGTSLTEGADCSGFTMRIYEHFGINTGRTSRDQAEKGKTIPLESVQPGDLIFYASGDYINHVAMYIGGGEIIHASTEKTGIKISTMNYRTPYKAVTFLD